MKQGWLGSVLQTRYATQQDEEEGTNLPSVGPLTIIIVLGAILYCCNKASNTLLKNIQPAIKAPILALVRTLRSLPPLLHDLLQTLSAAKSKHPETLNSETEHTLPDPESQAKKQQQYRSPNDQNRVLGVLCLL